MLVGAIFTLTVLATLAVYMASLAGVQQDTARLSVQGERAYFAARSGLEWALWDIVNNAAGGLACGSGPVGFTLTEGALNGFDVSVDCTAQAIIEGARSYTLFSLTAAAAQGIVGTPSHASRRLIATVAL